MADKKKAQKGAEDEEEVVVKKSRKLKLIVIGVAFAGLAAGAYIIGSKSAAPAKSDTGTTTTTTIALIDGCIDKPEEGVPDTLIDLPEMSINLADGHYLRAAVSLGLCADVVLAEGEEFPSAPAKDLVVSGLSGRDMAELSTSAGRNDAKEALTEQISAAYPGVVYEVYFVEFVMQ
jgi:flagellar basal body-associated protein FliL